MSVFEAAGRPARELASIQFFRYLLAALLLLGTVGVQASLNPSPSLAIPLLISLLGVIVTAYFCGRGPALCANAANLAVNWYFFAPSRLSFTADPADIWLLTAFAAAATAVALLSHQFSRARHFPRVLMLASLPLLVLVAVLLWFDFANLRKAEGLVEHTYQVLNGSGVLFSGIQDADSRQRGYLLTGEERFLVRYREVVLGERAAVQRLTALTNDNPAQRIRLAKLNALIDARLAQLETGISVRRDEGMRAAIDAVRAGEGAHIMNDIRSTLAAVESEEHRLLLERAHAAAAEAGRTRAALAVGAALLVILLIFAGLLVERDVGKLQASAREMRRQADLLDKAPGPIVAWQLGGAIEYWNRGAEELYGFSRRQALGRKHDDLLHPTHPLGFAAVQTILERHGEWSGELAYLIGGREIVVESRMTLLTDPDGRKTVLKMNRDITEEKRAQREIRELNRELEQRVKDRTAQLEASNQEFEAFAYSVSHDLRAPLRGIDGWSLALLEDYGQTLDSTAQGFLNRVRSETQRMGRLIDDLLELSRLTRVTLRYHRVDLSSMAQAIASRLKESEPGRELEFTIQEGLFTGGDLRLLEIVLTNLLTNAVKFTGPRTVARIEFGQAESGQGPAFFVRDNGVGFDMAYADMLFGAFQRLHKPAQFPGSGVGLATVQRVVGRHAGKVWADAKPDQGATFYFTIGPQACALGLRQPAKAEAAS
jgi:PAS domain S-box-containing protein